jgi:hypothetical protein
MMLAALALWMAPVVMVGTTEVEKGLEAGLSVSLDPQLCAAAERKKNIEAKCAADVQAVLQLRSMQMALTGGAACTGSLMDCSTQTAKLVHATHAIVPQLTKNKAGVQLKLTLVAIDGTVVAAEALQGVDSSALHGGIAAAVAKLFLPLK